MLNFSRIKALKELHNHLVASNQLRFIELRGRWHHSIVHKENILPDQTIALPLYSVYCISAAIRGLHFEIVYV